MGDHISNPGPDFSGSGPVDYVPTGTVTAETGNPLPEAAEAQLLSLPGVVSVGVGYGPAGGAALVVGVVDAGVAARLPQQIGGLSVITTVIGEVDALKGR
ncbi:hypothetical protein [Paracoccus sp. (in: a-proteobacteria)]|uniref:hypothetical protein n=1 Tax=Paracoccus sp. TaxID=267 RepID=UPI003A87319A